MSGEIIYCELENNVFSVLDGVSQNPMSSSMCDTEKKALIRMTVKASSRRLKYTAPSREDDPWMFLRREWLALSSEICQPRLSRPLLREGSIVRTSSARLTECSASVPVVRGTSASEGNVMCPRSCWCARCVGQHSHVL